MKLKKVVFLDRDGVINKDAADYIKSANEFEFIPKSCEAIKLLTEHGFSVIVITNQSVINRNMTTNEELENIFEKMKKGVEKAGGKILDIFYCPHIPEECCDCRKPKPKMIIDASKKFDIELSKSYMIGDSAKDIICGKNAGCEKTVLVKTGNGEFAEIELKKMGIVPDVIADNLYEAAEIITRTF